MTSEKLRLFVAVAIPREQLERVREQASELRARWPQARWTESANQHVTLKFLGWTAREQVDDVRTAIGTAAARHRPADLRLAGLGIFPGPRRARVLWVGLEDPEQMLTSLAGDLEDLLEPLGFRSEKRPFHPHLTLARFRSPERIAELPHLDLNLPPFALGSVELFRSHLHPRGARYEVLESFALGPGRRLEGGE